MPKIGYDREFFDYVDRGAIRSADAVIPIVARTVRVGSVLDVGCGRGGWARAWRRHGIADIKGIDGAHVDPGTLHIDGEAFVAADLVAPFDLGRRFDLVQCLEVAEHLPASSAEGLIDSITRHGDVVLFSAAVPGQGGTHHVNEQPLDYWRDGFARRGYTAFDIVRPAILADTSIEPWYRFNSLIYANTAGQQRMTSEGLGKALSPGEPVPDLSPPLWRLRKAVLRLLPERAVDALARINAIVTRVAGHGG